MYPMRKENMEEIVMMSMYPYDDGLKLDWKSATF